MMCASISFPSTQSGRYYAVGFLPDGIMPIHTPHASAARIQNDEQKTGRVYRVITSQNISVSSVHSVKFDIVVQQRVRWLEIQILRAERARVT